MGFTAESVAGVVLAGGKSKRLGLDKTRIRLPGNTEDLLARAAKLLSGLGLEVYISCSGTAGEDAARAGFPLIPDIEPGRLAMGGVYSSLKTLGCPCLVIACDMPFLREEELKLLLKFYFSADDIARSKIKIWAWRNAQSKKMEPLAAIYSPDCLPFLGDAMARQEYALRKAVPETEMAFLEYGPDLEPCFFNINYPEELEHVLRLSSYF